LLCELQYGQTIRSVPVCSDDQESSIGAVTCGVSHGFVLDPLLFISYINDVTSQGLSGIAVFTFMERICKFITLVLRQTFKGVLMS
jgi:hypothetical protein